MTAIEAMEAAELAARLAFIQASEDLATSRQCTQNAEKALDSAKKAESIALTTFEETEEVWDRTLEELRVAEEEARTTRASKFRAVVLASGIMTRVPATGLSYVTDDEAGSPHPSPRTPSPLPSSSVINSW